MTPYDAGMAIVIVAGMVWGAFRGITWQLASMASLVLGYGAARPLSGQVAPYLPGDPLVARALAMILVYFGVSGGIFLVAWLVRATLRQLRFEAFDRHLGMLLGGAEGALLGLVVTLFVVSLAPATRTPIFTSPTGKVVGKVMAMLGPVLPDEARGVLARFWDGQAGPVEAATAPESGPVTTQTPTPTPTPAPPPAPVRTARQGAADRSAAASPAPASSTTAASAPPRRDAATVPASFRELLERSQQQIGKAVIDGAAEGLRRASEDTIGHGANGRAPRR